MNYTLGQAAKITGKSKTTLARAVKSGKLSATITQGGSYEVDAAELNRVYPLVTGDCNSDTSMVRDTTPTGPGDVTLLRELVTQLQSERDDLRRRLDQETEERRRLTLMITGGTSGLEPPGQRPGFWRRLFGKMREPI